jgi:hypothetical protein
MQGPQVPLILVPRFTSLSGARSFATTPVEVSQFSTGTITVWRGDLQGASSTYKFYLEFSTDAINWTEFLLAGPGQAWVDPGAFDAETWPFGITYRWMRGRIALTGSSGVEVTSWAAGLLMKRTDG